MNYSNNNGLDNSALDNGKKQTSEFWWMQEV